MSKLKGMFGGTDDEGADEGSATPEPVAAPAALPPQPQSGATSGSIDEYASTLPAPDFVDPAGKASADAEAA